MQIRLLLNYWGSSTQQGCFFPLYFWQSHAGTITSSPLNWDTGGWHLLSAVFCNAFWCQSFHHPFLLPHPSPYHRHIHFLALYYPTCHSNAHLSSFAACQCCITIELPTHAWMLFVPLIFPHLKKRLKFIDLFWVMSCFSLIGACTLFCICYLSQSMSLCSIFSLILAAWLGGYFLIVVCKEPVKGVCMRFAWPCVWAWDLHVHVCEHEMTYKCVCLIHNAWDLWGLPAAVALMWRGNVRFLRGAVN